MLSGLVLLFLVCISQLFSVAFEKCQVVDYSSSSLPNMMNKLKKLPSRLPTRLNLPTQYTCHLLIAGNLAGGK